MWESVHSTHAHSHCHAQHHSSSSHSSGATSHASSLLEAEKYQLMDKAVQPVQYGKTGTAPLIRLDSERFSHVAVDVVTIKNHATVHVLYVATLPDGVVRKYSVLPRTNEACLVEIIDPFAHRSDVADREIRTMQFLKAQVSDGRTSAVSLLICVYDPNDLHRTRCLLARRAE